MYAQGGIYTLGYVRTGRLYTLRYTRTVNTPEVYPDGQPPYGTPMVGIVHPEVYPEVSLR